MKNKQAGRLLIFLLLAGPCWADKTGALEQELEWYAVMLNGSKMGHMRAQRDVFEDRVETNTVTSLRIERSGFAMEVSFEESSVETRNGRPLTFRSIQRASGSAMEISGQVSADGTTTVTTETAGKANSQTFTWPEGALLFEGLRLLTLQQGIKEGISFSAKAFVPSSLTAIEVDTTVMAEQAVDLFGRELRLHRVEQSMMLGGVKTTSLAFVTSNHELKKMTMQMMGMDLEMIACPEACATSPNEPTDFFKATIATAPQRIAFDDLETGVAYRLRARNGTDTLFFPTSSEQSVEQEGGVITLTVTPPKSIAHSPVSYTGADAEPRQALLPTSWIQSDAGDLIDLARGAAGDATDANQAMLQLETFVRGFVSDKNLSVGYASALEVSQTRSGDCTEHALLLAGLGRALGIPTRIATGMAYVDSWLGTQNAFVPHAWTQAYVDGRWVSYDAALNGFDAGHIALSYGDGDPWNFYEAANTIGNFDIEGVVRSATP